MIDFNNPETYKDLPDVLLKELKSSKDSKEPQSKLLNILQEYKIPLDINQLLIAYYDAHKKVMKRKSIISILSTLVKAGKIKRVSYGIYKYIGDNNE